MESAESVVQEVDYAPALTVKWLDHLTSFEASQAPVIVGREENANAQIRIPDNRISREHIVITPRNGQWIIEATGRNGVFSGSARIEDAYAVSADSDVDVMLGHPAAGIAMSFSTRDPVNVYIGDQIARRRKELSISQRTLADEGVVNAGALIGIEKGRSQPRAKTEAALETRLQWPKGHIERLRRQLRSGGGGPQRVRAVSGHPSPAPPPIDDVEGDQPTQLLRVDQDGESTATVEVTLVSETVGIAMDSIRDQVAALPDQAHPDYPARVEKVTEGLARLEPVMVSASGTSVEMIRELGEIRRLRRTLMLTAAASPKATLGQRVFAARRSAELSIPEAAITAGITAEEVRQAEAGAVLAEGVQVQLQRFVAALGMDTGKRTAG